ncbi:hypothetical protein [Lewinella sp. IMCC34191]|uniref:hypothetical protein n=1 Tax=Lewinella sp. IMCC34191 TaxID=2259172 RepID=UPI00130020CF|nr:hypothetical protein [Lewinella sp. IMCC34191]
MTCNLIQYEIRYRPILDFKDSLKKVLSKYVKFFDKINIKDEGVTKEQIELRSTEESYAVFASWQSLVLRVDGEPQLLQNRQSTPVDTFFKIFKDITSLESFGGVINHLCFQLQVELNEGDSRANSKTFMDRFFSQNLRNESEDATKLLFSIEQIKSEEGTYKFIESSVYDNVEYISEKGLQIMDAEYLQALNSKTGIATEVRLFERQHDIKFETFKNLLTNSSRTINAVAK